MRESKIERAVCRYAESAGWWQRKFVSPGHRGVPDRIFIRTGRVLFIEFKALGKPLQSWQVREIRRIRASGATVYVVDNIETGMRLIDEATC